MEKYMQKCLELAKNGLGKVSPNPLVGCVVLDKNGKEIATGFHAEYGKNHAERDALLKCGENSKGGTLFVNLEPCNHQGKTPPCTDLIIEKGIKKVVIAMRDPNPIAKGGIEKLKNAGIDVVLGIMEKDAEKLNEVFLKNISEKKCFVALKTATTLDGKIATRTGSSKWITSEPARDEAKKIRKLYDAILTTSSTVIADNPSMAHNKKIILDRTLKTDFSAEIYQQGLVFVTHDENISAPKIDGINFIPTPTKNNSLDLEFVFKKLFEAGIMSVLVECGGTLAGALIAHDLIDKIYQFVAPKILGDSSGKNCFCGRNITNIDETKNFKILSVKHFEPDILITYSR